MNETIHFRTKVGSTRSIGNSLKTRSGRSTEIVDIRSAQIYDDARDIVWKKSTGTQIFTKNRHTPLSIDIVLCIDNSIIDEEKNIFTKSLDKSLSHSSRQNGESYSRINSDTIVLETTELKNHLIFIAISSIDIGAYKKYKKLCRNNDVIFLSIFYPSELESERNSLFDSKIPREKYYMELEKQLKIIETTIHSLSGSNIVLRTSDIIPLKLNHYFKYRYGG